jgi:hypothetical protein
MASSSTWTPAMTSAFQVARGALSLSVVLAHPAVGAELSLVTNASATHVGAVIQQHHCGQAWRPLGFFSAQPNKAEANYSDFDRELLAAVAAIRHFRYMLERQKFAIFTDHKPLVGALHRRSDPISACQQRHLSFITEFAPSIRHITRESNIVADTLSRPSGECSAPPLPVAAAAAVTATLNSPGTADQGATEVKVPSGSSVPPAIAGLSLSLLPVDLVAAQAACPDRQRASLSPALRVSEVTLHGSPLLVDTSSGVFRPLVPAAFRRPIFDTSSQPGTPWNQGNQTIDFKPFCLAVFGLPGGGLVQGLPAVPAGQGVIAAGGAAKPHRQPYPAVQSHPH